MHQIFIEGERDCTISDACLIGLQLIERLQWIHSKCFIYRDIRLENILMGLNDENVVYIVDYGLCKKYKSSKTGKHIANKFSGIFYGTFQFASPNVVSGYESSRRDDLISLGYLLIFLLKKKLPWQEKFEDIQNIDKEEYNNYYILKKTNGNGELFKNVPEQFSEFIKYSRSLGFSEDPDYSYLSSLLHQVLYNNNLKLSTITFSWIKEKRIEYFGIPRDKSTNKTTLHDRILSDLEEKRHASNMNSKKLDNKKESLTDVKQTKVINKEIEKNEMEYNEIENNEIDINEIDNNEIANKEIDNYKNNTITRHIREVPHINNEIVKNNIFLHKNTKAKTNLNPTINLNHLIQKKNIKKNMIKIKNVITENNNTNNAITKNNILKNFNTENNITNNAISKNNILKNFNTENNITTKKNTILNKGIKIDPKFYKNQNPKTEMGKNIKLQKPKFDGKPDCVEFAQNFKKQIEKNNIIYNNFINNRKDNRRICNTRENYKSNLKNNNVYKEFAGDSIPKKKLTRINN